MYGLLDLKSDLEWDSAPLSFLLSSLNHLFPALCLGNESFAKPPSTQALQRNYKLPEPGLFRWMRLVSSLLLCLYPFNPLSSCSSTVFSIKEQVSRENSTTLPLLDTQFLLVQWIHVTNSDKNYFFGPERRTVKSQTLDYVREWSHLARNSRSTLLHTAGKTWSPRPNVRWGGQGYSSTQAPWKRYIQPSERHFIWIFLKD